MSYFVVNAPLPLRKDRAVKAKSIQYKTTIVGIKKIVLSGEVLYDPDMEAYTIGGDSADYWLERILGKQPDSHVILTINVHDQNPDDTELVADHEGQHGS